jgi:hypothetical protein
MDSRFKFIRGEQFQGLNDYQESRVLKVKKIKIIYPLFPNQTDLFSSYFPTIHPEYL